MSKESKSYLSELSFNLFKERMNKSISVGDPNVIGTPFSVLTSIKKSNKKYIGKHDSNHFEITLNRNMSPIPFTLVGNYKSDNQNRTIVQHKLDKIKFGYYWIRLLPVVVLILFNLLILTKTIKFESSMILIINAVILVSFINIPIQNKKKRKMEKEFKELMKIK